MEYGLFYRLPKGDKKDAMKSKSIFLINPQDSTLLLLRPSKAVVIANPPGKCINISKVPIMKFSVEVSLVVDLGPIIYFIEGRSPSRHNYAGFALKVP